MPGQAPVVIRRASRGSRVVAVDRAAPLVLRLDEYEVTYSLDLDNAAVHVLSIQRFDERQRVARFTSLPTYLASDYSDQSDQGFHGRRSTCWRPTSRSSSATRAWACASGSAGAVRSGAGLERWPPGLGPRLRFNPATPCWRYDLHQS